MTEFIWYILWFQPLLTLMRASCYQMLKLGSTLNIYLVFCFLVCQKKNKLLCKFCNKITQSLLSPKAAPKWISPGQLKNTKLWNQVPFTTIWWFRILGIFSVENIDRLGAMMFQTSDNSQLCIDLQYSSQQLTIVWSLIHHSSQLNLIFSRVKVLHLDRLWLDYIALKKQINKNHLIFNVNFHI